MSDKKQPYGYWYCHNCGEERHHGRVTYGEKCDKCGHPVEWITGTDLEEVKGYKYLISEQGELIKKLNAQIESLKCCGNCKHFIDNQPGMITDFTFCERCTRSGSPDVVKDSWEPK